MIIYTIQPTALGKPYYVPSKSISSHLFYMAS